MNSKLNRILALLILFTLSSLTTVGGGGGRRTMANGILYRVSLESDKNRTISVKQSGKEIMLVLEGFGEAATLKADGGGTSTCRTIIEHNSEQAKLTLSLPVPDPRAACRMLPGFVSVESQTHGISLKEATVKKVSGTNAKLRNSVEKTFGEVQGE